MKLSDKIWALFPFFDQPYHFPLFGPLAYLEVKATQNRIYHEFVSEMRDRNTFSFIVIISYNIDNNNNGNIVGHPYQLFFVLESENFAIVPVAIMEQTYWEPTDGE